VYNSIFKRPNSQVIADLEHLDQLRRGLLGTEPTIGLQFHIVNYWATGRCSEQLDHAVDYRIKQTLAECICETLNFVRPNPLAVSDDDYYQLLLADRHFTLEHIEHCVEIINADTRRAYLFARVYGPTSMDHYMPFDQWSLLGWKSVITREAELPGLLLPNDDTWLLGYAQTLDDISKLELRDDTSI